jgi:hypothetical protein
LLSYKKQSNSKTEELDLKRLTKPKNRSDFHKLKTFELRPFAFKKFGNELRYRLTIEFTKHKNQKLYLIFTRRGFE